MWSCRSPRRQPPCSDPLSHGAMKLSQRVIGWSLVVAGGISTFIGISPLFEIRGEAYLLGIALFASGAWVLAGKELRDTIRRALGVWKNDRRSSRHVAQRGPGAAALMDRLLPVRILKLAREQHGVLTVAQVAMELNVPLDQAQAGLDECVRAGNALPDYDITRGHALYRFPEFTGPDRDLLSN
jgi:hypothetical protein